MFTLYGGRFTDSKTREIGLAHESARHAPFGAEVLNLLQALLHPSGFEYSRADHPAQIGQQPWLFGCRDKSDAQTSR